jgi:hypothetical protein
MNRCEIGHSIISQIKEERELMMVGTKRKMELMLFIVLFAIDL